ncbi:MAG: DUF4089 domain-containing protein [Methylobacteriaceae bacterium]|nr:DUF4089 domain-containing protein [Methylobacteriaceae bacterium]
MSPPVTTDHFDADALIDAMAPLLGLAVGDEARPAVRLHLEMVARIAQQVLSFELGDDAEPAPIYVP